MKNVKMLVMVIAVVLMAFGAHAEDVPKVVLDGMGAYKTGGSDAAFKVWLKNSPMETDKGFMDNLKKTIAHIESLYGKMIGYEILSTVRISKSTLRTYAEVSCEKGPLFFSFDSYKTQNGWIIPFIRFNAELDRVVPESVVIRK